MKRKEFIKKLGMSSIASVSLSSTLMSCNNDSDSDIDPSACAESPSETAGPFPIKSPLDFIRQNIIGDRQGIPLAINITVQNINDDCRPVQGLFVDIWHCDAQGNYSEYDDQLDGDFTGQHFLRGRQTTDAAGIASFISIYPGWYPGRAPHLHLEILDQNSTSLLVTQTAFPEDISEAVYSTSEYKGMHDTLNTEDGPFSGSLSRNMAESVTGDTTNGYILNATIKVDI